MEDREQLLKSDPEFDRLAFTVLAIEASAQKMGISPSEMRKRLDKVGLIKSLIQDCYDTLHTESREAVASDVVEALKIWERVNIISWFILSQEIVDKYLQFKSYERI